MRATGRFLFRKIIDAVIILLLVTLGVSALTNLIPGSPAYLILGEYATPEAIAQLNERYGFEDPFFVRYWDWLSGVLQGDFGSSIRGNQPVLEVLLSRLPVTLELAGTTIVLTLLIAIPAAMYCAAREGKRFDRFVTSVTSGLQAVPSFVLCVALATLFANTFRIFPSFGWVPLDESVSGNIYHAALPVIILVLGAIPLFLRVLRADLITVLREDYVLAARAKGLPDSYIMLRHALRPASLSLFTLTGLVFGYLVGGSIILENFFALPGIGQAMGTAVAGKDLPLVQGAVVLMALTYLVLNTVVDLGLTIIDPQSRSTR